MIEAIADSVKSADKTLDLYEKKHQKRLLKSIQSLEDKMVGLLQDIKTKDGRVEGLKVNLKQTQVIHQKMIRIFEDTYGVAVKDILGDFQDVATIIQDSWADLGEAVNFTGVDVQMMKSLQAQTNAQYAQYGVQAQERIADALYTASIGGQPFSELLRTVRGVLRGHKDVRGRPMESYAHQHAMDSVRNFHNDVNIKKSEDLGIERFLYYGNLINTSRQFCRTRAGKVYSKKTIESWNDMSWSGKAGPPLQYRGGYNCRHHWRPAREEWFTDTVDDTETSILLDDAATVDDPEVTRLRKDLASVQKESQAVLAEKKQVAAKRKSIREELAAATDPKVKKELRQQVADWRQKTIKLEQLQKAYREKTVELQAELKEALAKSRGVKPPPPKPKVKPIPAKQVITLTEADILKLGMKQEEKIINLGEAIPTKGLQRISEKGKKTFQLRREWQQAEDELYALADQLSEASQRENARRWTWAGSWDESDNKLLRAINAKHQEVFERKMAWYRSLPREDKLLQRDKTVREILDQAMTTQGRRRFKKVKDGTDHLSYRMLNELQRHEMKINWQPGRACFRSSEGAIYLADADYYDVVAHELSHAIDSLMGSNFNGNWARTGLAWKNNNVFVKPEMRDNLRAWFKRQDNKGLGTYTNGDGKYFKGQWIHNYEGRLYEGRWNYIHATGEEVKQMRGIAQEWWAMNIQRYSKAIRKSTKAFADDVATYTNALEEAKSQLDNALATKQSKTTIQALEADIRSIQASLNITYEKDVVGYIEDYLVTHTDWRKVKKMYPEFAEFIEEFHKTITRT